MLWQATCAIVGFVGDPVVQELEVEFQVLSLLTIAIETAPAYFCPLLANSFGDSLAERSDL